MGHLFDFIANSRDGVLAVDRLQTIVLWNEGATTILGFSAQEVLGRKCYELLRGLDAEACVVCQRDCEMIGAARRMEFAPASNVLVRTKNGNEIWVNISTVVVPSRRRELSVLIHMFRDVTRALDIARAARELAGVVEGDESRSPKQPQRPSLPSDGYLGLTPREREVLGALTAGSSTEGIAKRLSISSRTVRNHVSNILSKLGVHSRLEAVTYSIENRLV